MSGELAVTRHRLVTKCYTNHLLCLDVDTTYDRFFGCSNAEYYKYCAVLHLKVSNFIIH